MVCARCLRFGGRLRCRLLHIAFDSDMLCMRFFLALGAMFVGFGLLLPSQVFPDPSQLVPGARTTYLWMARMAPEWTWGGLFTAQGLVQMWSLVTDRRSRVLLWLDAVFGCVLWTTAVLSCFASYWIGWVNILDYKGPFIMGGELATVFASWWVMVRYTFDGTRKGDDGC